MPFCGGPRPSIPNPFFPPPTSLRSAGGRGLNRSLPSAPERTEVLFTLCERAGPGQSGERERAARVWLWAGPAVHFRGGPHPSIPNPFLPPPTSLRSAGGRGFLLLPHFEFWIRLGSGPSQTLGPTEPGLCPGAESKKKAERTMGGSISGLGIRPLPRNRVEARRGGRGRGGDWGFDWEEPVRGRAGSGASREGVAVGRTGGVLA